MAEHRRHDVVNQTRSGGDSSPSDVPVSKLDKESAGGDVGGSNNNIVITQTKRHTTDQRPGEKAGTRVLSSTTEAGKSSGNFEMSNGKMSPGLIASKALELNGLTPTSDVGEDTGSLGGSESDTSRADGRHHIHTGPVKKLTPFKPVSFTKFAVPKAPGSIGSPKMGEKAPLLSTASSVSPQPSTRPRLVAKSTSGLRDSASKPVTLGTKNGGTNPDPTQVWNKNRPVQPPPSKHLTDEELKQQYGIHMTSRIQEDGNGTEAKWADIDDDEDDWAPETIEWNDGTKITLTHPESVPVAGQDTKASKDMKETPPTVERPGSREASKIVGPKSLTSVGPNATILRLGANAERQHQAKIPSLFKALSEKPTLTAKTPASVPAKSPWATLPPVDKVPPVIPPVQTQNAIRLQQRDSHAHDSTAGSVPPKEIAADDFNRSWRDNQSTVPKELYNSQSGRYEPVSDTKNGPSRTEQPLRTPSLLQRPSHNEQIAPAEPSPAFQTHRTSHQEGSHWTRRRTSSNVSGGSGSLGRRMSLGRPDVPGKVNDARRGSQANGSTERPTSPRETPHAKAIPPATSPNHQSPGTPWQQRSMVNMNHPPPGSNIGVPQATTPSTVDEPAGAPQVSEEDPIAMQQRIMREKRLEARQRRLEQEEREEAERRERIRLKLEALGPFPEKDKSKTQDQPATTKPHAKESITSVNTGSPVHAPPKPPVPEPTGEPKQYGMMKVHHPESVKKLVTANEKSSENPSTLGTQAQRATSPTHETKVDVPKANGFSQAGEPSHAQIQEHNAEPTIDEKSSQWRGNLTTSTSYSPWGPGSKLPSHTSSNANLWKPNSNDKTLGNGTFDRSLSSFPPKDVSLRGHLSLADQSPIGPPSNTERISGSLPFSGSSRVAQDSQPPMSPLPSPETRHTSYESLNPIARPGPIGPPGTQQSSWQPEGRRVAETAAWNNFHAVAAKKETEENERFLREFAARRDDGAGSLQVNFNETWRQVRTGEAGQRQVVGVARTHDAPTSLPSLHVFDTVDGLPFTENHSRPFGNVTGRGSRFFPPTVETNKRSTGGEDGRAQSPSPPPPEEMSSHPAFTGDSHKPLVHLPTPKPVVKLPPKSIPAPSKPTTFASMAAVAPSLRVVSQPIASTTTWQDRFNGLFGKKTSVEKKNVLAITSATKEPLDVQSHFSPVAVSLPQSLEKELQKGVGKVTSKEVEEEEEIFEDREAGSLPVVRVPNMAPPAAWRAALPPPLRLRSKFLKPMQVQSIDSYSIMLYEKDPSGNLQIPVRLPGRESVTVVTLTKKMGNHASRQRSGSSSNFRTRRNAKSRESTAGLNPAQTSKRSSSSNPSKGGAPSTRESFGHTSWGPPVPGLVH